MSKIDSFESVIPRVGYHSGWLSLGQGMTREREEKRHMTYATETFAQITAT